MRRPYRLALCAIMLLQLGTLAGCGGGTPEEPLVIVSGTLHKGGQPLPMDRPDVGLGSVQLTLTPVGGTGSPDYCNAGVDGTFKFIGAGNGVAPGKYRLEIIHNKTGPGADELKGAFAEAKSPITLDVPADKAGDEHNVGTIELNDHGAK